MSDKKWNEPKGKKRFTPYTYELVFRDVRGNIQVVQTDKKTSLNKKIKLLKSRNYTKAKPKQNYLNIKEYSIVTYPF